MGLLAKLLPVAIKRRLLSSLGATNDDRFARIFHASPDWIVITRLRDGLIVDANKGFETISGYRAADVLGHPISQFNVWAHPEQRARLVSELTRVGSTRDTLVQLRRRDGSLRDCMVNATRIALEESPESHAVWIARDVTEARKAATALQESEARFSRLFDESPLPMCYSSDADGFATTQWNRAWFAAFGFDPLTAQGRSGAQLGIWVHPEERQALLNRAVRGEDLCDIEVPMLRADHAPCWISMSTRTFVEPQRTLVLFTYFDITERRRAQEEIQILNAELEARVSRRTADLERTNHELSLTLASLKTTKDQLVQSEKMAALGALVAGVAHELNTPIGNGLTVASSLHYRVEQFDALMDKGLKRSDLRGFLEDTRQAADILTRNLTRAGALVTSFKQVAVDQTSSQRREFSLAVLVSEILLTLSPTLRKLACAVSVDIADPLQMDSYPGPLGQVLTNLINNALVHGFPDNLAGTIAITAHLEDGDRVVLQVQDDGLGIQKADLPHIFEPFFTTRMGQGGSGLGLHIVHNLMTSVLGGTIDAHSEPGHGACFRLTMPRTAPEQPDKGAV